MRGGQTQKHNEGNPVFLSVRDRCDIGGSPAGADESIRSAQTGLWFSSQEPARFENPLRRAGFTGADLPLLAKESTMLGSGAEPRTRILPLRQPMKYA